MKIKSFSLVTALFFLAACGEKQAQMGNAVQEYAVIAVQPSNVSLKSSYPATIKGKQDVEIRPKVAGFITKLYVDEGAVVRKGQPLFQIDPVQYREAVNAAKASIHVAESNVATLQLTANNKKELLKKNIISQYDMEMAENQLASGKAVLAQTKAQLVDAEQNLSYTTVTSPSDGVIGSIPFRLGSLVSSSIQTPLTVVSDISEMYVYFSMTEKQLLEMTREGGSIKEILAKMPAVSLQLIDGTIYAEQGRIETVSGVIDAATGSVSMRATFPNKKNVLRSGGTGTIMMPYNTENALVIPQKSTYEMQDKRFVYVVGADSKVKNTEVSILKVDDGQGYVVTSGLNPGDKIVYEGAGTLRDGMEIKPITPEQAAAKFKAMSDQAAAAKAAAAQKR